MRMLLILTLGVIMATPFEQEFPTLMEVAKEYDLNPYQTKLLMAIRQAENGPPGFEFGVKAAKGTDLRNQAQWTAASIKKNVPRYEQFLSSGGSPTVDFIQFMGQMGGPVGKGWAPVQDVPDGERRLNKNWPGNVRSILKKMEQKELDR
jgi:hypothetical protein